VALGSQLKFVGLLCALWLAGSCHPSGVRTPSPTVQPATSALARGNADAAQRPGTQPTSPDLGDPSQQFIVHLQSGEIALRSRSGTAVRVLAPHADEALYHAALELIWFVDGDRLSVIDLRVLDTPPVIIALGLSCCGGHLSIIHPSVSARTDDDCDVPSVWLHWDETPTIEATDPDADAADLRIVNAAWLVSQLTRPARPAGERRRFAEPRVRLPKKRLDCEDQAFCGATVPFGARGLLLVTVLQKMGGDCWQRGCLLRDPRTKLFSTPPDADTWGPADKTNSGTCGIFLFDRTQTSFLVQNQLCVAEHACQDLGGWALGWLVPGDAVGAP
jgi:hypothetical protein